MNTLKMLFTCMLLATCSILSAQTHVVSGKAQSAHNDAFAGVEVSLTTLEEFRNFDPEEFMGEIKEYWASDSIAIKLAFTPKELLTHPNGTTMKTDDISVIVSGPFETVAPRLLDARDKIVGMIDRFINATE